MSAHRPAELAGRWYPSTAEGVRRFLEAVPPAEVPGRTHGAIAPHAGWVYSGAVAQRALSAAQRSVPDAQLVIVFGGHLGPRDRVRVFLEGAWDTPLGPVPMASGLAQDLSMAQECELESPDDYFDDNAVEVLMPMVKAAWPQAEALVVGVPPVESAPAIGDECVDLAQRRGYGAMVVLGSTDLTHYGPNYDFSPHGRGRTGLAWVKGDNDPAILAPMQAMEAQRLLWIAQRSHNACCPGAAAAAIQGARRLGARRGHLLEYTTSYDVRPEGEPTSFVGYAGVALSDA